MLIVHHVKCNVSHDCHAIHEILVANQLNAYYGDVLILPTDLNQCSIVDLLRFFIILDSIFFIRNKINYINTNWTINFSFFLDNLKIKLKLIQTFPNSFWCIRTWFAASCRSMSRSISSCSMWFCFSRRISYGIERHFTLKFRVVLKYKIKLDSCSNQKKKSH